MQADFGRPLWYAPVLTLLRRAGWLLARNVSAGTHGYFRSWVQTGYALGQPATAALDPKRTRGLPIVASVSKRKNVLNHSFGYLLSLFSAMTASRS